MPHSVLTLGDIDAAPARAFLKLVDAQCAVVGPDVPPRAVVTFADLRGWSRQDAKEKLRALATLAAGETRRRETVRHVLFAVLLGPAHARAFDRLASHLGERLHADIEREKGRDVEVTFLDVSLCADMAGLAERMLARSTDPAGGHDVVVLDWEDIRSTTIRRAARDEYL